jgi:uncharacterized protein YbjQ (UPF0145 family)
MMATTPELPGYRTVEHVSLVAVEVVRAIDFFSDIAVNWRDDFGGRCRTLEGALAKARRECLDALHAAAVARGANAVVAVRVEISAPTKSVLIVSATGSAVVVESPDELAAEGADVTEPAEDPRRDFLCEHCGAGNWTSDPTLTMSDCSACLQRTPVN